MAFTLAIRNGWLNGLFGGTIYVSLHSADPGNTGASELSGNGYSRVDGTGDFSTATTATLSNTNAITFGPATGSDWLQATYFGFWSAGSGGTFYGGFPLTVPKTIEVGDTGTFGVGDLDASIT